MPTHAKKVFAAQLTGGQQFQDVFLVTKKSLAETKAGKPYLALALMDRTGEVEARVWDNALRFESQAEEGHYVLVQAMAKPFRDQMQLGVTALQRVDAAEIDMADFLPTSPRPLAEMAAELEAVIASTGDQPLRDLLQTLFRGDTLARFQRAPAAKRLHHAYIGGLIEHTLSIVGLADKVADHYPLIDRDMLIAGALVHDLAKIEEFDFSSPAFGYTDRGRLVGHLVLGVDLVRQAASQVPAIDPGQVDRLIHIILSHHGRYEYGSPVLPMTPEAILLHHLDDIDAKMNSMAGLQAKMNGDGWRWTDYQRHLERFLYLRASGDATEPNAAGMGPEEPAEAGEQPPHPLAEPVRSKKMVDRRQQSLF
ncbi:3'-5' exoribonuclease YhaM family protein [Desulfobulbus sp.]|uniref:3'-5' exoribonuclease YhaM family protein n=1 Tax=Desulfobulbus sp. TaxID=895 RepID=UPI00286F1D9E|nr:3'-5' exoribonuclease YhaM family protein [Desulfobulbus sp.]